MSGDGEWWDLCDAEGVLIGGTFRRGGKGVPAGLFHVVATVCVERDDGALLLTQRAAGKEFAFDWEFPGGSALAGESSRDAAGRELWEESSVAVVPSALILVGRVIEASALVDVYVARIPSEVELILEPSEVMAAQWVAPEEVMRRVDAGLMAAPWVGRLEALWPSLMRALRTTP